MDLMDRPCTIKEVAEMAKVSIGSVSRYINGKNLKSKTADAIKEAIDFLGYEENLMAKGLKNRCTMTIGALIYDLSDEFSLKILSYLEKIIEKQGYCLLITDYKGDEASLQNRLSFFKKRFIDALVCFPYVNQEFSAKTIKSFNSLKVPIVAINEYVPEIRADFIMVDNRDASFRAVEHLIHKGHKDIVIINGNRSDYVSIERLKGYREALELYGINIKKENELYGEYSVSGGYSKALDILKRHNRPDAVFTTNYRMANGFILAMNELNLKIPQDINLITFDHSDILDVVDASIPYVEQPLNMMGEIAADTLLKRIHGDNTNFPEQTQLKTKLIVKK